MSYAATPQPVMVPRNGFGITALVLALVGLVFGLMPITAFIAVICGALAILFALLGHGRYRRHEATNNKMCVTSGVLGVVTLALGVYGVVMFFQAMNDFSNEMEDIDRQFNSGAPAVEAPGLTDSNVEPVGPGVELKADDFEASLRTTSKQCYQGLGCDFGVVPEISYTGDKEIPEGATCEITYVISGDQGGPITETATMYGDDIPTMPSFVSTSNGDGPGIEIKETHCP